MAQDVRAPHDTAALRLAELTEQHTGTVPDKGHIMEVAEKNVALTRPGIPRQTARQAARRRAWVAQWVSRRNP